MPGVRVQEATVPAQAPVPAPVAMAGISCRGSAVTAHPPTIPARLATPSAGTAEEAAATVAAVVINWKFCEQFAGILIYRNRHILDSFQCWPIISLELLQNTAFPFASGRALKYR